MVFPHPTLRTAIDFRRGDMNIGIEEIDLTKPFLQAHQGDDIGHHPVIGIGPAFGDHALCGEVDDAVRPALGDQLHQRIEVMIEVDTMEGKVSFVLHPAIAAQWQGDLLRAADADDVLTSSQKMLYESGSGKRIRPDDKIAAQASQPCTVSRTP